MKLSTPPSPFSATFALTMSAMLLFASFELAQCKEKMRGLINFLRKCIGRSPREQSPSPQQPPICGAECEKWGENTKPTDYTLVIKCQTDVDDLRLIFFATAIGKRLALTNRNSLRSHEEKDYSVFIWPKNAIEDIPIHLNRANRYCRLSEIHISPQGFKDQVVLLLLDKDLPNYMVLASLAPPKTVPISAGMICNIPLHKVETQTAARGKPSEILVTIVESTLSVKEVHPIIRNSDQQKLVFDRNPAADPSRGLPSVGASVIHKDGERGLLFGILGSSGTAEQFFILTIDTEHVLEWIYEYAGENCVCKKPQQATK